MDWDEFARPWLDSAPALEAAHQPVIDLLMAEARLQPGERVLDVGCGTGPSLLAALPAVEPGGTVTGIDIAPPLVARAAERLPDHVELLTGDAGRHAYADGAYDVILSNFGLMFFDDTRAAMANLRRATRPGGRLAATVWGPPPHNPWFTLPRRAVDAHVPDVPRPDPTGPGPMRFADPAAVLADLSVTGWNARCETHDIHLTPLGTPADVAAQHRKMTLRMILTGMEIAEETLARIEADLAGQLAALDTNGGVRVPARIHLILAEAV